MSVIRSIVVMLVLFGGPLWGSFTLNQNKLGNVFLTTETVSFPILNASGNTIEWIVTDYFGQQVGQGTATLSGGAVTIQPNLGRRGWFQIQLTEKSGSTVLSQMTTNFAVLTPVSVSGMGNSPFGAQTHFAQSNNPEIMPLIARAGIAHIRDEHYWAYLENPAGTYSYPANFTNFMSAAAAQQVQPMITLDWANPNYDYEAGVFTGPHTDNGRLGYANYGRQLLQHYGSQIGAVEVWNEYNAGTFIQGPATSNKPYYYYLMLKKAYETIKPSYPGVKVLAGGTVPIAHGFLRDIFAQGAMPYLDAVSVHPYRSVPEGVDLEISELRELIKSYNGGQAKPIWATEFSMNVDTAAKRGPAAAYTARIVTLMLSQGVERMYYYLTVDDDSFPYRGLLQRSNSANGRYVPNPAYVAYANSIRQLYGWTSTGRLSGTATTTYLYKFTNGANQLHVCWATAPTTVSFATTVPVTVVDLMGNETTVSPSGGAVTLSLSTDAVYLKGTITGATEAVNTVVADSLAGYSKVQGQSGWYYGYANKGPNDSYQSTDFQQMSWAIWLSDRYMWKGAGTYHIVSLDAAHPDSNAWAIRRWQSNMSGTVRITGSADRGANGDGVGIRIFVNGTQIYNYSLAPGGTVNFDIPNITVSSGSYIDFAVTRGSGDNSYDGTGFSARITKTSGASTYALSVVNGSGSGNYSAGTVVNVAANAPASGYVFAGWTGATGALANPSASSTTLTMPAAATAITATYTASGGLAAPVNLIAQGQGSYSILLQWTDMTSTETGFELQSKWGSQSYTTLATLSANVTSYLHTNAPPGRVYTYRVRALQNATTSAFSNEASASQESGPAMYGLIVTNGTGDGVYSAGTVVTVIADTPPVGYEFAGWTGGTGYLANPASSTTTLIMPASSLSIAATYVQLAALIPPSNFTADGIGNYSIQLQWTDMTSTETGFEIQFKWGSDAYATLVTVGANVTSYIHTNAPPGRVYTYRIRSVRDATTSDFSSEVSSSQDP